VSNAGIARQLGAAFDGSIGGTLLEDTEELPVRVRIARRSVESLRGTTFLDDARGETSLGGVPFAGVAKLKLVSETAAIFRRNGRRVNVVQGYLSAGALASVAVADYRKRLAPLMRDLPPGYTWEFGGEAAKRNESIRNLMRSVPLLLAMMVATLVLSLKSFRLAGIIVGVGGLSIGLGLLPLELRGLPFGFMAILGTMGLVGVAINDSIVVLSAICNDPQSRAGDRVAIRRVVMAETRHVLATTLTTMVGFVPLLVDGGTFWPPLALTIAGGVAGATVLAIVFVPSAYVIVTGKRKSRFVEIDPLQLRQELGDGTSPRREAETAPLVT
jgi:multidrug efflux pump